MSGNARVADKRKIAQWILLNDPFSWKKGNTYKQLEELEKLPLSHLLKMRKLILTMKEESEESSEYREDR